jgi:hypothetical protein
MKEYISWRNTQAVQPRGPILNIKLRKYLSIETLGTAVLVLDAIFSGAGFRDNYIPPDSKNKAKIGPS